MGGALSQQEGETMPATYPGGGQSKSVELRRRKMHCEVWGGGYREGGTDSHAGGSRAEQREPVRCRPHNVTLLHHCLTRDLNDSHFK